MKKQIVRSTLMILAVSVGVLAANGAQTIRELWDGMPSTSLNGATNGPTSLGFFPNPAVKWVVNPLSPAATNNSLQVSSGANVDGWMIGRYDVLPPDSGDAGAMALIGANTNGWDSSSWAVRFLDTPARINTAADGVYYFSARLLKRSLWWGSDPTPSIATNNYGVDDAALGLGFASGSAAASRFVGAGFTRTVPDNGGGGYLTEDGSTEIGDTVYITQGALGQAGYTNHPSDSGGPYYVRATGWPQWVTGYLGNYPYMDQAYVNGGFLVGKLTTSGTTNDFLQVYTYVSGEEVPTDESGVVWDVEYSFSETANLSYLLVWMHGNNNANSCLIDAIRVGTTYAEVIGVETVGPPKVSAPDPIYEGTPLTLSIAAYVTDTNATYVWRKGGTPIVDGTNATHVIASATIGDSGNFDVIYSNYFGLAVTSQVKTLTVLPAVPPTIDTHPAVLTTRYTGAPAPLDLSVTVSGSQPFSYQWYHITGGSTNGLFGQTNQSLVLTNLQASDAGGYFVTVANWLGSDTSDVGTLQIIEPTPGSYAASVLSKAPDSYWPLNETGGTNLYDNWGGKVGSIIDPPGYATNVYTYEDPPGVTNFATNVVEVGIWLGDPGVASAGFPEGHTAMRIPNNQDPARANLASFPYYSNKMTWCCWVYTPTVSGAGAAPGNDQGPAFLLNRDRNSSGGYGNAFGLTLFPHITEVTNNAQNQLGYKWGGGTENPTESFNGYRYTNSALYLPSNQWSFVAWVVDGAQTKLYLGANSQPLTVATDTLPAATDANWPNTAYSNNFPILLGRTGWPWSDDGDGVGGQNANVSMSDIALFTSALSDADIHDLYLSALGEAVTVTPSGSNVKLEWPAGTLQAAPEVWGVYTNVPGATSPHIIPASEARKYFRAQR